MRADQLASVWKRILAYIIDIFIVNSIITRPFNKLMENAIPKKITSFLSLAENFDWKTLIIISLVSGVITILYWAVLEFKIQQTLGSLLLNIKVKSESKKLQFSQLLLRNITKISFVVLLLDSIPVLYSAKKQRYTEKLSKTITVENEK